jgi:agmatinase
MSIDDKIRSFDPNGMGDPGGNIYGLPFNPDEARLVILPVPWEVTVSYRAGTAVAPEAIKSASYQVDLYDPLLKDAWKLGISMKDINPEIVKRNTTLRLKSEQYIAQLESGTDPAENTDMQRNLHEINIACYELNQWVKNESLELLNNNKIVALLGGDHSTPLGLIQALAEKHADFGILHIDAHADLREAYEGFEFSHASIMYNAIKIPQLSRLIQVGIRDYCEAEVKLIETNPRIITFFDRDLKHRQYAGQNWELLCENIIEKLPQNVYVSFDIDGLDPKLCPNTGTPVPGGLEFEQSLFLVEKLVNSGRTIIGFDLNEVAPGDDEWDANVGARLLYRLANMCLASNR